MKGLSFLAGGEFFAADVTRVQKVARKMMITPVPTAQSAIVGITNLKGRVITIFSLDELLGRNRKEISDIATAVIFKSRDGYDQMGLLIDKTGSLVDIDDTKIRPPKLASGTEESFCISGIAESGDKLYRIIDIDSIINKFRREQK